MKINYWNCEFAEVTEKNVGTPDVLELEWVYSCTHPENWQGICHVENKNDREKGECSLLGAGDNH